MKFHFEITVNDDHLYVVTQGEISLSGTRHMMSAIAALCEGEQCFKVLGYRQYCPPLSTTMAYDIHEVLIDLGFDARYQIAWVVEDDEGRSQFKFAGAVMVNNTEINVRVFEKLEEAKAWLELGEP